MAQFLCLNDIHLRKTNPGNYVGSYSDDLFDTLYASVEIAKEYRVKAIIAPGDLIDCKQPSQTPYSLIQQAIDWIKSYDVPFLAVIGNHDIQHGRLSSVYETQPIGVLLKSGATDLRGWAKDFPIYGVPWQQRWTDEAVSEALADWREPKEPLRNPANSLVVTHAPMFPPGEEPMFEHYLTSKWAKAMGNQGSVTYGHIHEPHGTYTVDGVQFCNNGAISRGSIAEYNLTRKIYATIWDSKTNKFERIDLPHKPSSEIFRVQEVKEQKENDRKIEEFIDSIGQSTIEVTSIESVIRHVKENMDLKPDLVDTIEQLLVEANDKTV